jgi:hypothetical protein
MIRLVPARVILDHENVFGWYFEMNILLVDAAGLAVMPQHCKSILKASTSSLSKSRLNVSVCGMGATGVPAKLSPRKQSLRDMSRAIPAVSPSSLEGLNYELIFRQTRSTSARNVAKRSLQRRPYNSMVVPTPARNLSNVPSALKRSVRAQA